MRKFQKLIIEHPHDDLVALLNNMKAAEKTVFEYRSVISTGYARSTFQKLEHVGMFRAKRKSLFESMVWVIIDKDCLKVVNITPSTCSSLGIDQYNYVLTTFFQEFIAKFLDESWSGCVHITGEIVGIDSMLTPRCYEALKHWELSCNKSSPIAHPNDEARWLLFVSYLHKDRKECSMTLSDFQKWLSEDMKWPSGFNEQISEMQINLEYSLSLLEYYDRVQD